MQNLRSTLVHALLAVGIATTFGAARADTTAPAPDGREAAALPSISERTDLAALMLDSASPTRAPVPAGSPTSARGPDPRAQGQTQVALGGTHCWWACYPGSGCQYICQFFPQ